MLDKSEVNFMILRAKYAISKCKTKPQIEDELRKFSAELIEKVSKAAVDMFIQKLLADDKIILADGAVSVKPDEDPS